MWPRVNSDQFSTRTSLSLSIPVPLSLSVSSALILSLHSQPYLWAWERNSGNIFPCETPSTSRGVWRHCIVSAGEKRNRARWGQILSTPKKQALSHTGFLPRWTAQNNPNVVGPKECERGINHTESKREAGLFLSVYADCLWAIKNKQRGNTTHTSPQRLPTDIHTTKNERALYHSETTELLGRWIDFFHSSCLVT